MWNRFMSLNFNDDFWSTTLYGGFICLITLATSQSSEAAKFGVGWFYAFCALSFWVLFLNLARVWRSRQEERNNGPVIPPVVEIRFQLPEGITFDELLKFIKSIEDLRVQADQLKGTISELETTYAKSRFKIK